MSLNSSNSDYQATDKYQQATVQQNFKPKKIKDYLCPCGRSYGSYPALYSHIKRKHDGKPPGQVVKPKPLRRRGRPFKYEPVKLQSQNTHKNASRHLEEYLRRIQNDQHNQFPLKQFASLAAQKIDFPCSINSQQQYIRYQYLMRNSRQNDKMWVNNDQKQQQWNQTQRQSHMSFMNQQLYSENLHNLNGDQNGNDIDPSLHFDQKKRHFNQIPNYQQMKGQHEIRNFRNNNPHNNLQNSGLNNEFNQFLRMKQQQKRFRAFRQQQNAYNMFESIYSKPYEMELKQEMQDKFIPIAQGMSEFLQPILKQLINSQQKQLNNENVIDLGDNNDEQKEVIEVRQDQEDDEKEQKINDNKGQINSDAINIDSNQNIDNDNNNDKKRIQTQQLNTHRVEQPSKVQCRDILQNQHMRDIVRWMMTPPQQQNGPLTKQNYIQNSFRCCLVEFLDFCNQFLEKVQYQQVLLVLVFFCDHILALTGSFENKPQPLVYEMLMYFNTFLSEYVPKLVSFMPLLNKLFVFTEYNKKISELFMWMSMWQSIQQYYHNRYFRQRIMYELQQENMKSLQYQQKYNMYINQAQKQNVFPENINNDYLMQRQQAEQQHFNEPQEKTQQNPQPILLISNHFQDQHNHLQNQNAYYEQQQYQDQINQQNQEIDIQNQNQMQVPQNQEQLLSQQHEQFQQEQILQLNQAQKQYEQDQHEEFLNQQEHERQQNQEHQQNEKHEQDQQELHQNAEQIQGAQALNSNPLTEPVLVNQIPQNLNQQNQQNQFSSRDQ